MRGLDNPCTTLPGVEVDAGVVPLADQQLLGQLGVVVVVGILGHVAPAEYTWGHYGGQGELLTVSWLCVSTSYGSSSSPCWASSGTTSPPIRSRWPSLTERRSLLDAQSENGKT